MGLVEYGISMKISKKNQIVYLLSLMRKYNLWEKKLILDFSEILHLDLFFIETFQKIIKLSQQQYEILNKPKNHSQLSFKFNKKLKNTKI